jgi:hypothetical protein
MLFHRRITLVCATAALAVAPSSALAMPARDAAPSKPSPEIRVVAAQPSAAPVVREVRTDGDTTLALVLSGSALLIAAGAVALSGHDHRRIGKLA